jgi:hypothetical protein
LGLNSEVSLLLSVLGETSVCGAHVGDQVGDGGGGHRLDLRRRHVGQAGIQQRLLGISDERLRGRRVAEQVQDEVDQADHRSAFRLSLGVPLTGLSGDLLVTVWIVGSPRNGAESPTSGASFWGCSATWIRGLGDL